MWYSLAGADHNFEYVTEMMTPEQIARPQQFVADWENQHPDPTIYRPLSFVGAGFSAGLLGDSLSNQPGIVAI